MKEANLNDAAASNAGSSAVEEYAANYLQPMVVSSHTKVYIPENMHAMLKKLVKVAAPPGASMASYITSILVQHIREHSKTMTELYTMKTKKLFRC